MHDERERGGLNSQGAVELATGDELAPVGVGGFGLLRRVHGPMMWSSLLAAALLVFVEVLKELPATLILRPFNYNTLAVRAFELANDERLAAASLPALTIVLVGIIPVIILNRLFTARLAHVE